jgi:signal transduction histidine kinase
MKELIEQILKISEIEIHPSQKISIDLHSSIQKILDSHSVLFEKKGINLISDIEASKKILIDFTENDFQFILNNLLSNALKYTSSGKNVYVSVIKVSNSNLFIEIKDEGIGIAKIDLDKITTIFFRANHSRNSDTGGHGLGLAIVDKLLSKNGHKLEFSSILGEGSTFNVNLRLS